MTKTIFLLSALLASAVCSAQVASRYQVVITEIMADPTPTVGLPNAEYIEIKNVSPNSFNLSGWRLSDATSTATISTSFTLQPDSVVILCATSQVTVFSAFGRAIGVPSFPSLDNDGDVLTLRSPQNRVIHAVAYSADWYGNAAKSDGGWSLEMIDLKNPCTGGSNWKASVDNSGGTPGRKNSVDGANPDNTAPQLRRSFALDSVNLILVFDEPLDSVSASAVTAYSLPGVSVQTALPQAPLFQTVQLRLASPLQSGTVYNVTVTAVADCKGNAIATGNQTKTGLPQPPVAGDVVINEILFNPRPNAYDYVEVYNRSQKIIDAAKLYLANGGTNGTPSSLKKLSEEAFYLFPGDYAVVTEDAVSLKKEYLVKNEAAVLELSSLPSFPDDKGTVVLVHLNGDIIDEVAYDDDWHFGLIDNKEGVALERIDPFATSQNKNNWHSASTAAGYGTPGYQNSQYKTVDDIRAMVDITPKVFSPDNDGRDDFLTINYKVEERGYVANVFIFDAVGRQLRHLVKNELLQLKGVWNWDGLGENKSRLPVGQYIVLTEIFNLQGKRKSFKNVTVLARQFN